VDISVILATYNQPDWLEKVVWGYAAQLHQAFEIVVADDGSTPETAALISRLRRETGINIQHVWHRDQGFRKCRILNQAILKASSNYLVFSDGDCIPRKDFLCAHVRYAAPGRFLSGGVVRLPSNLSNQINIHDIRDQKALNLSWLRKRGMPLNKKCLMLTRSHWKAKILDRLTTTERPGTGITLRGGKKILFKSMVLTNGWVTEGKIES
jgi:glycosyltransferase involved in cell wall biosynthesis